MDVKTVWKTHLLLVPSTNYEVSMTRLLVFVLVTMLILPVGCNSDNEIERGPTPYSFPDIFYYPNDLNIPIDNPTTEEGVLLGRYLFHDGRLSGRSHPDSLMSCSTCHSQKNGFDVGLDHPRFRDGQPVGLTGIPTPHFPLPLANLVYNSNGYLWNGLVNDSNPLLGSESYDVPAQVEYHFKNIESLVWMSIVAPHEINGSVEQSVELLSSEPLYPPMFNDAFGTEEINIDRISKAIAQFVRTIISNNSRYHQYIEGNEVLSEQEYRGLELFFSEEADCFHCHGGFLMTTNEYYNNAKDSVFNDERDRFAVTGDNLDRGAYKAPSLINVELTGPYMHDGRFKTLEEVIDFYSEGLINSPYVNPLMKNVAYGGVRLLAQEKQDLVAFLKTLTDHQLVDDPKFSKPEGLTY